MDNRPIGVFDSGLGGLTMVKALKELIPNQSIIYLGDTGRFPYGPRSKETIEKYAGQNAAFLAEKNIKAMVAACNTVCSVAFDAIKNAYTMPVYEVVRKPAAAAVQATKNNKIGIIGTTATIRSGAYEKALRELKADLEIHCKPCPLLAPLVEEGWTNPDDEAAVNVVSRYLKELAGFNIDTLILGCTHYPLLTEIIKKIMGKNVKLIDSGAKTAEFIATDLKERNILPDKESKGTTSYYVTDCTDSFSQKAAKFLGSDINDMVTRVELER